LNSAQGDRLTHVDATGAARMVDVSGKATTVRTARATGRVLVSPRVVELLRGEGVPKGDALSVARIAGIMGAKRTPELIPLCHPIGISGVSVDLSVTDEAVEIAATVRTADRTGVEMEALTAVAVAGLTVIDMVKAVDKGARIDAVQVESKTGGKSGDWHRGEAAAGPTAGGPTTAGPIAAGSTAAGEAAAGEAAEGPAAGGLTTGGAA